MLLVPIRLSDPARGNFMLDSLTVEVMKTDDNILAYVVVVVPILFIIVDDTFFVQF